MQEINIDDIPVDSQEATDSKKMFHPFGTPITNEEVAERLSDNLYIQLSDGDADFVANAVNRAEIYVSTILHGLHVEFSLDIPVQREIVLMQTLYELHMALGHEEAGREYRQQAKNTIIAAYGSFPDADNSSGAPVAPAAKVVAPPRNLRLNRLHSARRTTV